MFCSFKLYIALRIILVWLLNNRRFKPVRILKGQNTEYIIFPKLMLNNEIWLTDGSNFSLAAMRVKRTPKPFDFPKNTPTAFVFVFKTPDFFNSINVE
jgi:hypothetical protein